MDGLSYPQKLLAELFGTAMLVFVGVGSVPATLIVGGDAPFTMAQLGVISFAFAMVVVALIYAIGHVSGCQINPAITVALAATGKMPWREVPGYIAEAVGTFILAFVVFGAIHKAAPGGFAGLAIGMAVFAAIIPVAPATGASINPARTLGPMLVQQIAGGSVQWGQLPVYLLAEFVGALAAGFLYGAMVAVRSTASAVAPVHAAREGARS